jgi:hypothetical protein
MTDLESPLTDAPPPAPRRSRRNIIVAIAAGVVVVVALVAGAGEWYVRDKVKSCMSSQFQNEVGTPVRIGLGSRPVLLDWMDGTVPSLTIDSEGDQFGPAVGMKVHAVVRDIRLEDSAQRAGTVGSSEADVNWSADGIAATLKQRFAGMVTGVTTNAADGTIEIDGLFSTKLTVRPSVADGVVNIVTQNAQVLGIGLPTDLVDSIVKALTSGFQQKYPVGLTARSVHVTDTGVNVTLGGSHFDLPKPPAGQQNVCT